MLSVPCLVVSDLHLGAADPSLERSFRSWLEKIAAGCPTLVINGDLFDFWFEWKSVMPRNAFRVLAALAALREAGQEILWVGGNHDCWGGEILRADVGVNFQLGDWQGDIGGWRTLLAHGDGLRPREDRRYRALRRVLRNRAAIAAFRLIPPDLATTIAMRSSAASRTHRGGARDAGAGLREVAIGYLERDRDLDLVIFGHSHIPSLIRAAGGGIYANAGSWIEAPTYLRITDDEVSLFRWNGSAEGERLDALDRRPPEGARHA